MLPYCSRTVPLAESDLAQQLGLRSAAHLQLLQSIASTARNLMLSGLLIMGFVHNS